MTAAEIVELQTRVTELVTDKLSMEAFLDSRISACDELMTSRATEIGNMKIASQSKVRSTDDIVINIQTDITPM